jgi:hypothetical protein
MTRSRHKSGGLPPVVSPGAYNRTDIDPLGIEAELIRYGHAEMWCGHVASDQATGVYEVRKQEMFTRANALLGSMGVELAMWHRHLGDAAMLSQDDNFEPLSRSVAGRAAVRGVSPAELLFRRTYFGLPIEIDEAGDSYNELVFSLPGRLVSLIAQGDFWSDGAGVDYEINMESRIELLNSGGVAREKVAD